MNKTTITLIVAFVVLAFAAYFFRPKTEEREASYDKKSPAMSLDSSSIIKIQITKPGKSVTLENVGGKWMITSPISFPVNMLNLFPILGGMGKFKVGSLISSNPEKQQLFQVDSTGVKLAVTDRSGKTVSMIVGKMGPSFSEIYFRPDGSNDVYLGEGFSSFSLNQELRDWREKAIYFSQKELIARLEYKTGDNTYVLSPDSTATWKLNGDSVDANEMNTALTTLADFKAEDFADTLHLPETQPVNLKVSSSDEAVLSFYPQLPDSAKYYVQTSKSTQYYVVGKWSVQQILKPIEKYLSQSKKSSKKN